MRWPVPRTHNKHQTRPKPLPQGKRTVPSKLLTTATLGAQDKSPACFETDQSPRLTSQLTKDAPSGGRWGLFVGSRFKTWQSRRVRLRTEGRGQPEGLPQARSPKPALRRIWADQEGALAHRGARTARRAPAGPKPKTGLAPDLGRPGDLSGATCR